MKTLEELASQEASMKHAITRWRNVYSNGGESSVKTLHYLTCEKCRLRKLLGLPREEDDATPVQ